MNKLYKLSLRHVIELGDLAYQHHQDLEKWRPQPLNTEERKEISNKLKKALEEQHRWAKALLDWVDTLLDTEEENESK